MTAARDSRKPGLYGRDYYSGEKYQDWLALARRFMESHFPGDPDTLLFHNAEIANGNGDDRYHPLMSILKAFEQKPPVPITVDIMPIIAKICNNFNKFDANIRRRYANRPTITITDEHDVQKCNIGQY